MPSEVVFPAKFDLSIPKLTLLPIADLLHAVPSFIIINLKFILMKCNFLMFAITMMISSTGCQKNLQDNQLNNDQLLNGAEKKNIVVNCTPNVLSGTITTNTTLLTGQTYKRVLSSIIVQCKKIVADFILKLKGSNDFQEHYTRYVIWLEAIQRDVPFYEVAGECYRHFLSFNNRTMINS